MGKGKAKSNNEQKDDASTSNTNQQASTGKGNNYQAGGNIYINDPGTANSPQEEAKPKKLDTWQKVVAIIVGITAIITFFFTFREKMGWVPAKQETVLQDSIFVSGLIRDSLTGEAISNAWVTSDLKPGDTILTASNGTFELYVPGKSGQSIRIYTGAKNYQERNEYHTLPRAIAIYLNKK
ncbi:hypothetical protein HB364_17390 [Pseudoflavitalea sp. X16]|uniref:hypothetical protein n=1 Tax=Paraflavitalea devenefica TaxID=2716334 RepID=UPI00141F6820|nr:hypothetical protein [Paraflavitalea devenefica]NII26868.1 hypothetical protein [Paraflavitalea devenefica]